MIGSFFIGKSEAVPKGLDPPVSKIGNQVHLPHLNVVAERRPGDPALVKWTSNRPRRPLDVGDPMACECRLGAVR